MPNFLVKFKKFLLIFGDVLVLYFSLLLALAFRYETFSPPFKEHLIAFSIIYLVWLFALYGVGFYDLRIARNNLVFYSALFNSLIINAAVGIFFFYFIPYFNIAPKTILFINILIFSALFWIWRNLYNFLIKSHYLSKNILIIGRKNETLINFIRFLKDNPQLGFRVKKRISPSKIKITSDLGEILVKNKIKILITSPDCANPSSNLKLNQILYHCIPLKIELIDLVDLIQELTGKVPIEIIDHLWFVQNLMLNKKRIYETFKRLMDIFMAMVIGIFSLPLYPLIILLIKWNSKGPVFILQNRVGQDNIVFKIIKFRSMYATAPDGSAENRGAVWMQRNDPRVTRVGRFLRRFRFDELPQAYNILKGEMSFVGPRPERPEFVFGVNLIEKIPYYQIRHLVKPGLTGWAQINFKYGSSIDDAQEKLKYELYYIKNRSLILDIQILLKTIQLLFRNI